MAILGQCEHRVFAQARSVGCRVVVIPASIGSTRWTSSRPAPFSACVRSVLSSLRRASGDRRSSSYAPSANLSRSTLGGYRPTTTSVPHRRLASPVLRRRTPLWRPWAGERSPPAGRDGRRDHDAAGGCGLAGSGRRGGGGCRLRVVAAAAELSRPGVRP